VLRRPGKQYRVTVTHYNYLYYGMLQIFNGLTCVLKTGRVLARGATN
jgi:hypothetical protein